MNGVVYGRTDDALRPAVAVVGGGVSALWLALRALRCGVRTTVVNAGPFGSHSTTGNQGWLHSGALYALNGAFELAAACDAGSADVRALDSRAGGVVAADGVGAFIPRDDAHLNQVVERLAHQRIRFAVKPIAQLPDVSDLVRPEIREGQAVVTADGYVDTRRMVAALLDEIVRAGGNLVRVREIGEVFRARDNWALRTDLGKVQTPVMVLALGTWLPTYLGRFVPEAVVPGYTVTRSRVLRFDGPKTRTIVVPLHRASPTVVPTWNAGRTDGLTVCIPYDNEVVDCPDEPCTQAEIRETLAYCVAALPGLGELVVRRDVTVGMYRCRKLMLANQQGGQEAARLHKLDEYDSGLYGFYAGKMSAAPAAARTCVQALVASGALHVEPGGLRRGRVSGDRAVADRPQPAYLMSLVDQEQGPRWQPDGAGASNSVSNTSVRVSREEPYLR